MDLKKKLKNLLMSEFAYDLSKYEDEGEAKVNNVTENLVRLFSSQNNKQRELLTGMLSKCEHKNIDRQDGCDECLDCGVRNY